MRQIKFRAWSETKKKMAKIHSFNLETMAAHLIFDDHQSETVGTFVPMQFTGLLDKNGKEIYEGDIIEHEVFDRPYSKKQKTWKIKKQVYWDSGFDYSKENIERNPILKEDPSAFNRNPQFSAFRINKNDTDGGYHWSVFSGCEIIGNIYENKELLK